MIVLNYVLNITHLIFETADWLPIRAVVPCQLGGRSANIVLAIVSGRSTASLFDVPGRTAQSTAVKSMSDVLPSMFR